MHVLLIEDDPAVGQYIVDELVAAGHQCLWRRDGDSGLAAARSSRSDVLVVDRMLPGMDGLTLVSTLRNAGIDAPVLMLSALGEVGDRVRGLQTGADDYLAKPFAMDELLARLEVLQRRRRSAGGAATVLKVDDLALNLLTRVQPREFKLLEFLMRHPGQVVTRTMLLEHVWGYHFDPQTNVIDVHISRLRQKIDRDFDTALLVTVRGVGYRLGGAGEDRSP